MCLPLQASAFQGTHTTQHIPPRVNSPNVSFLPHTAFEHAQQPGPQAPGRLDGTGGAGRAGADPGILKRKKQLEKGKMVDRQHGGLRYSVDEEKADPPIPHHT